MPDVQVGRVMSDVWRVPANAADGNAYNARIV